MPPIWSYLTPRSMMWRMSRNRSRRCMNSLGTHQSQHSRKCWQVQKFWKITKHPWFSKVNAHGKFLHTQEASVLFWHQKKIYIPNFSSQGDQEHFSPVRDWFWRISLVKVLGFWLFFKDFQAKFKKADPDFQFLSFGTCFSTSRSLQEAVRKPPKVGMSSIFWVAGVADRKKIANLSSRGLRPASKDAGQWWDFDLCATLGV